jgi:hypothetical protein
MMLRARVELLDAFADPGHQAGHGGGAIRVLGGSRQHGHQEATKKTVST